MTKAVLATLCVIIGGIVGAVAVIAFLGWGTGQLEGLNPTRADYIDFLLSLATILLAAVGIFLAAGAVVVGFIAFKTMREIKEDSASEAQNAARAKINETLPDVLKKVMLEDQILQKTLSEMTQKGSLDWFSRRVLSEMDERGELNPIVHRILSEMAQKGELAEFLTES